MRYPGELSSRFPPRVAARPEIWGNDGLRRRVLERDKPRTVRRSHRSFDEAGAEQLIVASVSRPID